MGGALGTGFSAVLVYGTPCAISAMHLLDDLVACLTIMLAASAIMAVGAGISAFVLLSVERADA